MKKSIVRNFSAAIAAALLPLYPGFARGAADMVQVVQEAVSGAGQTRPTPIPLAPGSGVTISFLRSSQKITRAWLANPAFADLDSDCRAAGRERSCSDGAKLVQLRRSEDLDIPGLPKTATTTLTLVASGNGGTGIYVFTVYKSSRPGKLIYEIAPARP